MNRWFRVVLVLRPKDFAPLLKVLIVLGLLIAAKAKSQTFGDEERVIELHKVFCECYLHNPPSKNPENPNETFCLNCLVPFRGTCTFDGKSDKQSL
tara:strand:+ start:336 stop:623 length:288 start_codon:yes stop_codon:yes gene_type:complete